MLNFQIEFSLNTQKTNININVYTYNICSYVCIISKIVSKFQINQAISGIVVNASNDSSISVCMYIMYIWIHMWQEKNFYVPTTSPVRHHRCENANIIIIMISIPYCFSMAI